jgi:hypothetical protein
MVSRREFNNIMRTSDSDKENIAPQDETEQGLEEGEVLATDEHYQEAEYPPMDFEHLDPLFRAIVQRIDNGNLRLDLTDFTSRYYQLLFDIRNDPNNEQELVTRMVEEISRYEEIPESDEEEIDALREHATLNWTACYDDYCQVHLSEKQGLGWYPRGPRKELNVISKYLTPPSTSEKQESQEPLHAIDESPEDTSYLEFMEEEDDSEQEEDEATENDNSDDEDY